MSNIADRRKKRALEAKRDKLLEQKTRATVELAKTRAELKSTRKQVSRKP
jgi:hypothetical protein